MYQLFKYAFWTALGLFALYLAGFVASYFIVQVAFEDFKEKILPIGYFLPFVLIICFLGMKYFNEEDWVGDNRYRKPTSAAFYSSISITMVAIVLVYLLVVNKPGTMIKAQASATEALATPKAVAHKTAVNKGRSIKPSVKQTDLIETESKLDLKTSNKDDIKKKEQEVRLQEEPLETVTTAGVSKGETETAYKPISKAYFYEEPKEETQRRVFIKGGTSSLPLKPRDEKNGFVYVITQDKEGIPMAGWLQKKDLQRVKMVYNDGKE